ncbi:hypothetical protein FLONG3_9949 [Fusarium longipes]|uniref:Uncharacterized protein n=1 Tax=Fusarium longipes TaxID=694270 RepID=A0A395RT26_9HYPO|nr:hypothetical protein FLONG3_9949 [Fusarium longipes]
MTRPSYQCTLRDDASLPLLSHCVVQKNCNLVHDNIPRSARDLTFTEPSSTESTSTSPLNPMAAVPPESSVLSLLSGINPRLSVQELEVIPSARLQRLYNVKVTDGPSLLLALPPPAIIRLLRSEKSTLGSEAAMLRWLSPGSRERKVCSSSATKDPVSKPTELVLSGAASDNMLTGYLPLLLRHESVGGLRPIEYNLTRPPRGTSISALSKALTSSERRVVDFQAGQLLCRIASQVSPTRRFGLAADVLSVPPSVVHHPPRRFEGSLSESKGADSWRVAFHSLMESVLRDGEDLTIMLNYKNVRHHFARFAHLLDAVKKPRLVVMDAGEDSNTLVHRAWENVKKPKSSAEAVKGLPESKLARGALRKADLVRKKRQDFRIVVQDDTNEKEDVVLMEEPLEEQIELTGLRQWSNCIFGDPLIASIFSKASSPSDDFWRGFDTSIPGQDAASSNIIEDRENAHIRILLYKCYHTLVAVVGEYYRPQNDSSKKELAARKHLANVLAQLEDLDDMGRQWRRRPSGEMSPAKRPRSGQESDEDSES